MIKIQRKLLSIFYLVSVVLFYSHDGFADFTKGGNAYKSGDYKTAAEEFLKVAEKGDHRAMYALGSMYAAGNGVEQSYKEAFKWFSRAAKHGRPDAQYKLGVMYNEGAGVKQDYNRAGKYYSLAAKSGYPLAQFKLGLLYSHGNGVKQNYQKAYAWLTVAGLKLKTAVPDKGRGSTDNEPTDVEVASTEYKKNLAAAALQSIKEELEIIKSKMTPEESDEANKLAENYSQYRRKYK